MFNVKITESNKHYIVELPAGKMHVLTRKALIWNLKHVFKVAPEQGKRIMSELENSGYATLNKEAV